MKVLLCGATAGSNFGDFLFAYMFQEVAENIVGKDNVFWYRRFKSYSSFFEYYLDNHNKCRFSDIDLMVYISGGYFFGWDKSLKNYIARFFRYCIIGLKCILFRKPYIIVAMEVGPSRSRFIRSIQRYIIKKAKHISVRNLESYNYVHDTIRKDVRLTVDTALCISKEDSIRSALLPKTEKRILLHVHNNHESNKDIIEKIIPTINTLLQKYPWTVAISMDQYADNQKSVLDEIADLIQTSKVEKYVYDNPFDLCSLIFQSDIVITTKLHVGIIACRYGKSVFSFSAHTEKIQRFYNMIGESQRSVPLKQYDIDFAIQIIERYKDLPVTIDNEMIRMAESNLIEVKSFIESEMKDTM